MTASRISRSLLSLASLTFVGIALAAWLAPAAAAERFGLQVANAAGTAAIRADIGGLFLGMAATVVPQRHGR